MRAQGLFAKHQIGADNSLAALGRRAELDARSWAKGPFLLAGNPKYDSAAPVTTVAVNTDSPPCTGDFERAIQRNFQRRTMSFGELPGASAAIDAIGRLLPPTAPQKLRDQAATEQELVTRMQTVAVVHIATHGFFLEPAEGGGTAGEHTSTPFD